jgi:glyoxylase-like metal-dependent hydrolase (beta-lactamase superfamily II)
MDCYEVYALKYAGPFTSSGAFLMWLKDWEKIETRNYYIWCLKGAGRTVVVDGGTRPQLAKDKRLPGYVSPTDVLSRIHVDADQVRHVVLTHMHWDHASGLCLFPNATFYVQETEYKFWMKDPVAQRPPFRDFLDQHSADYLATLEGSERLVLLQGDREILPGVECLLAPGHTVALQATAVHTARGTAIIGSDCAHVFRNYQEDWPSAVIVDLVACMRTFDKLKGRVSSIDLLFPGHDRLMSENYPEVAEGVTRLA